MFLAEIFGLDNETFLIENDRVSHPLDKFTPDTPATDALAKAVGCSRVHLVNIKAGRKSASLALAKRLAKATGLQMDVFLRPEVEAAE